MSSRRAAGAAAALLVVATTACVRPPRVEEPAPAPLAQRSRILASDGTVLATLFTENRDPLPVDEIPRVVLDAVVAAEDQRFWSHRGVDLRAIARAWLANRRAGRTVQGGSTITQQYVKNVYYSTDRPRTLEQKIREAQLARKLEREIPKHEILGRYLNTVYFGDGAYGIKAAAERYFGRPPADLGTAEAALLAGLVQAPERYQPRRHPEQALRRRNHVLQRMVGLRMITVAEAGAAAATPLALADSAAAGVLEPHFVEYVKRTILGDRLFGRDQTERADLLFRGGIDLHTTIDLRLQAVARESVARVLDRPGDPEAALVALDPRTGKVLAMVGGRDFSASQVNLALGAEGGGSGRQTGSAFKPFVLAAALEKGLLPSAVYSSTPPVIRVSRTEVWRPQNVEGRGHGPMTLESAMTHSVNAVFARLGMDVGPARVAGMARRMGITPPLKAVPSISLGTEEVSPLDMASAYATLAGYGTYRAPSPVARADLPDGGSVVPSPVTRRALDPGAAWLVTSTLRSVVERGTGVRARLDRPAAGKTGTSEEYADAWFVGYTPDLVTAVWVGYREGRVPMSNVHGIRVVGGTFPATIWRLFMERALEGLPALGFDLPSEDLVTIDIDPATGLLAGPYCRGSERVQMLRQLAPVTTCPPPPQEPSPAPSLPGPDPAQGADQGASPSAEPPSPGSAPSPSLGATASPIPGASPGPEPAPTPAPSPAATLPPGPSPAGSGLTDP